MNLRYHNLELPNQSCVSVLSLEPQFRTIFTMQHGTINLPWPNLIFVFSYKDVEGGFLYPGLYGQGLRVLLRAKPLLSFDDSVAYSPTEHHAGGMACTDHGWDNTLFKHPTEMIATILEIWWGSPHHMNYYHSNKALDVEKWKKFTLEDSSKFSWNETTTLRACIPGLPKDAELKDEPVTVLKSVFKKGPKRYGC